MQAWILQIFQHSGSDFPNSRRQQADTNQVPCLGSTVLEWTVNLDDLWALVLSGALCSVRLNWHAFLCEKKARVIMLKLLGTTVQNLVALRPGAWELCSHFQRICRTVLQRIKAALRNCNTICTYVLVVACLPLQLYVILKFWLQFA